MGGPEGKDETVPGGPQPRATRKTTLGGLNIAAACYLTVHRVLDFV